LVGQGDGLSSERSYVFRTLPVGVARSLADAAGGDLSGLGRAAAIATGLATTTWGYVVGRASSMRKTEDQTPLPQLDSPGLAQSSVS
ncbi:MAG: glycosyltransferase family 2 protein, partial [Chloroflexota bacterium]|nr:glycosyltransferase family 2 protein [Chloroflexota bacterium]